MIERIKQEIMHMEPNLNDVELYDVLIGIHRPPIEILDKSVWEVFHWDLVAKWKLVFHELNLNKIADLLEVAPGEGSRIAIALKFFTEGRGKYHAVNLNRKLTEFLLQRLQGLSIEINVIEDDAKNILYHFQPESLDIITANHAIDNIFETIIAHNDGIDTANCDYLKIAPDLIKKTEEVMNSGQLDALVHDNFIDIFRPLVQTLKRSGYLVFNHFVLQEEIDFGGSMKNRSEFVRIAKRWLLDAKLGLEAVPLYDFDDQWCCLRKE